MNEAGPAGCSRIAFEFHIDVQCANAPAGAQQHPAQHAWQSSRQAPDIDGLVECCPFQLYKKYCVCVECVPLAMCEAARPGQAQTHVTELDLLLIADVTWQVETNGRRTNYSLFTHTHTQPANSTLCPIMQYVGHTVDCA